MKSAEDLVRAYARSLPVQAMVNSDLTPEHFYHAFLAGEAAGFQRGLEAALNVNVRMPEEQLDWASYNVGIGRVVEAIQALSQPGAEEKQGEV